MEEISGVGGEGVERIREVSWRRSIVRGEGSSGIVRRVASILREDEVGMRQWGARLFDIFWGEHAVAIHAMHRAD